MSRPINTPDSEPAGMCMACDQWIEAGTGKHVWLEFDNPMPPMPELGMNFEVRGTWTSQHKECNK